QHWTDRGKVNVMHRIGNADAGQPEDTLNRKLARGDNKMHNEIRDTTHIEQPVNLHNVMNFDGLSELRQQDEDTHPKVCKRTKERTIKAAESLLKMRQKEESQLKADLLNRVDQIGNMLAKIQAKTNGRAQKTKEELLERIKDLIESDKIDDDRLEMEVAVLVDKKDITE